MTENRHAAEWLGRNKRVSRHYAAVLVYGKVTIPALTRWIDIISHRPLSRSSHLSPVNNNLHTTDIPSIWIYILSKICPPWLPHWLHPLEHPISQVSFPITYSHPTSWLHLPFVNRSDVGLYVYIRMISFVFLGSLLYGLLGRCWSFVFGGRLRISKIARLRGHQVTERWPRMRIWREETEMAMWGGWSSQCAIDCMMARKDHERWRGWKKVNWRKGDGESDWSRDEQLDSRNNCRFEVSARTPWTTGKLNFPSVRSSANPLLSAYWKLANEGI